MAVGASSHGHTAMIVNCPDVMDIYQPAATWLRAAGCRELTQPEFESGDWPEAADTFVDVRAGILQRIITSGRMALYSGGQLRVNTQWQATALLNCRVLVGLLPPGRLSPDVGRAGAHLSHEGMLCGSARLRIRVS